MKRILTASLVVLLFALSIGSSLAQDKTTITLWRHETGDEEVNANLAAIERFNASQDEYEVVWETLPPGTYTESIQAAALVDDLPCVFDMDQPTVPNFAWSGNLIALDDLLDADLLADLNAGGRGTYNGELYSVGQFDVALTVYALRSVLEENGVRIPTVEEPWTLEEFNSILETLAALPQFEYPMAIQAEWDGEWLPYGYSPWLQSFGGDLINRDNYLEAEGVLNGEEAIAFGEWYQNLFEAELVDVAPVDDQAFVQQRVAMHYTGSWSVGLYTDTFGDDLLFLPPPDLGNGPVVGSGSWQWGISSSCEHPEGAAAYINFILTPEEVAAMSEATSLIPTTSEGAALTENYAEDGKWRAFYEYSANYAISRPETPAYPFISSRFGEALLDIRDGGDVQDALDDAVDAIEQDIDDNGGYGFDS